LLPLRGAKSRRTDPNRVTEREREREKEREGEVCESGDRASVRK